MRHLQRSWAGDWSLGSRGWDSVPGRRLGPVRPCLPLLLGEQARARLLDGCEKLMVKSSVALLIASRARAVNPESSRPADAQTGSTEISQI